MSHKLKQATEQGFGLLHWAKRAVAELDKVGSILEADPVHDLRVAIRRCRSMAEGLRTIDPDPGWKQFRKLGKPLFSALGDLRDTQVMQQWLASLASEFDALPVSLTVMLATRENELKRAARNAVADFNRKKWLKLAAQLEQRTHRIPAGSRVYQHLALERWAEAYSLHEIAMRTRQDVDLHQLRVGIKRFRYTVENFLPDQHKRWSKDLKHMQDLLGEVHDLDVLRGEVAKQPNPTPAVEQLKSRISAERAKRVLEYQSTTSGPRVLWEVWRQRLPSGRHLSLAVNAKLGYWARMLDPEPSRSRRVAQISVKLWHELRRKLRWRPDRRAPALLRAAALLHNIGAGKRNKKRESFQTRMVGKLSTPVGWSEEELRMVQLVSRYAHQRLPSSTDEDFSRLSGSEKQRLMRLAGMVRLADVLHQASAAPRNLQVRNGANAVFIYVDNFDPLSPLAVHAAAARHLLEVAVGAPILILPTPAPQQNTLS